MKNLLIALVLFFTPVSAFAQQSPDVGGSSPEIHRTEGHGESLVNVRPETHGATPLPRVSIDPTIQQAIPQLTRFSRKMTFEDWLTLASEITALIGYAIAAVLIIGQGVAYGIGVADKRKERQERKSSVPNVIR